MAGVILKINDSGSLTGYVDGDIIEITQTNEALLKNIIEATPLPVKNNGELNALTELRYTSCLLYRRFRYERTGMQNKNSILQVWDLEGASDPLDGNGADGEYYVNTTSNEYFIKEAGSWTNKGATTQDEIDKSIVPYVNAVLTGTNGNREMFGTVGNEIWFSGSDISKDDDLVGDVWTHIEANSALMRADYGHAILSDTEFKHFLSVPIVDVTDTRKSELVDSIYDNTDPENPVLTTKRKFCIDIDLLATNHISPVIADIRDFAQRIDIMDGTPIDIETVIIDKTV